MSENKLAYLIGIKGVGMTALAIYLKESGYSVTGSDNGNTYVTDEVLDSAGIKYNEEFSEHNILKQRPDLCVVSAAYGQENPEFQIAIKENIKVLYFSEMLGKITSGKKVVGVAGVHGKTTITAMISLILTEAGLDPNFIIGAPKIIGLPSSGHSGKGDVFVLEADEYRQSPKNNNSKFFDFNPEIAIISSIEFDHPDIFATVDQVYEAFYKYACRVPRSGSIILCTDYPKCRKLKNSLVDRNIESYGFDEGSLWKIKVDDNKINQFVLEKTGQNFGPYILSVPGNHNILNATAAIITAKKLGVSDKHIKSSLEKFVGVGRRFEKIATIGTVEIYDDYAHHPTAIIKTLESAKNKFKGKKIWAIFQPHTFSRTESLLKDFGKAFNLADKVLILDIFSSEREKLGQISAEDLVLEIQKNMPDEKIVSHFSSFDQIVNFIKTENLHDTVILTIGAGDIYKLARQLANTLKALNG